MCYILYLATNKKILDEKLRADAFFHCREVSEDHPVRIQFEEIFIYELGGFEGCSCCFVKTDQGYATDNSGWDTAESDNSNWYAVNQLDEDEWLFELEMEKEFKGEYTSERVESVRRMNQFVLEQVQLQPVSLLCVFVGEETLTRPHLPKVLFSNHQALFFIPCDVVYHCTAGGDFERNK